jgi:hypothetical protein
MRYPPSCIVRRIYCIIPYSTYNLPYTDLAHPKFNQTQISTEICARGGGGKTNMAGDFGPE